MCKPLIGHTLRALPVLLVIAFAVTKAHANEGVGISVGDSKIYPEVGVFYFNDSNIYSTRQNERDDSGVNVRPQVRWVADSGLNTLSLTYQGDIARHNDDDTLDFDNHDIAFDGLLEFSSRSRLQLVARKVFDHEPTNTGRSRFLDEETPDLTEFEDTGFNATFQYGARTAKGGLEFSLEYAEREYTNNEIVTDGYSFDRVTSRFTFSYAVSSATRLTTGLEYAVFDSEESSQRVSPDNNFYFLFGGADWEITGKTGGSVKLGVGAQDYDLDSRDDQSTLLVRAGTYWQPIKRARLTMDVNRRFATDTDSPSTTTNVTLGWRHRWSDRTNSTLRYIVAKTDSDTSVDNTTRQTFQADMSYSLRRWLDLVLTGRTTTTSADVQNDEFNRQWYGVGLKLKL